MQTILLNDRSRARKLAALERSPVPDPKLRETVARIVADVAKRGDAALIHYTAKFGGPRFSIPDLYVNPSEIATARAQAAPEILSAIRAARKNVAAFARRSLRKTWFRRNAQGAVVGERFDPFDRVGIYIPGGTAPLVSTAVMTCSLAAVAGVREIVAVTPPGADGAIHPALLLALSECGATEIYRAGGAQAVAALAFGTGTIRPVRKIFGPGNAYVVEAKRQVFGRVAVDLLPGPSEVLVIADDSARPEWVAADLLAQCEHGHGSAGVLLSDSGDLVAKVAAAVTAQARESRRRAALAEAMRDLLLIEVEDMDEAIRLANAYAAEHVSIATAEPGVIAARLTTTGAIFLGGWSPVAAGDFLAGPSHELPTGGAGKSFAGLTVDQFQRRTSVVRYDEPSLRASTPIIEAFCAAEGLDAHARSATIRLEPARRNRSRMS